ncbi:hypothetical protein O0Q50_18730 [Priestia aryabhattai]|uniref:Uncharacterized protein n=1 Tax=Priestia aryabhattai TaxID=412384 RepID=A0AAX6NCJ2_PRIAR|nr:hypothetical protein [Priestia aryabhattai]MDU9693214.1 hypothetical protein [Priestia aryabhattai]
MGKKTYYIVLAIVVLLIIGTIYNYLSFTHIAPGLKDDVPKYFV